MKDFLEKSGYTTVCLCGSRSAGALAEFKEKKAQFLICSNMADREVDVAVANVINVTRRMALSITLVSTKEEKIWLHKCRSKGANCHYDGHQERRLYYLARRVKEHLDLTFSTVDSNFPIPVNEFDGKVVYGNRRTQEAQFCGHAPQMATSVAHLGDLERSLQISYLDCVRDKLTSYHLA